MKYDMTIAVLESKQRELDVLLEDKTKQPSEKFVHALLYDELTAAIELLHMAGRCESERDAVRVRL